MEVTIKSLNIGTFDNISEVFGERWFNECRDFYDDGVEVCNVSVNIDFISVETATDGVWLKDCVDGIYKLERDEFLSIKIN